MCIRDRCGIRPTYRTRSGQEKPKPAAWNLSLIHISMLAPVLVAKLTGALAAAVLALCLKSGPAETGKAV